MLLTTTIRPNISQAQSQGQVIFFDDFEAASGLPGGWSSELDGSVTCPSPYATTKDDVSTYVVAADNWPGHGRVMTCHANVHSEPATFANSISARSFNYLGGGNYQADFEMRLWRTGGIYKNSYYGMNLTISRNHVDHFAEVNIETNPYSADYGYLMYKKMVNGEVQRARIAPVAVDTNWHHLIVNVHVDVNANYYKLESVFLDGTWHVLSEPLATRSVPVTWAD